MAKLKVETGERASRCRAFADWHPVVGWRFTFSITVRLADEHGGGKSAGRVEISVVLNGTRIHERHVVDDYRTSPIRLRQGGSAVRFRNIWIESLQPP